MLPGLAASVLAMASPGPAEGPAEFDAGLDPQTIVGGQDADLAEFEAVVAFVYQTRFCTGTVVAPTLVLTAAHCLDNLPSSAATGISVRFGALADAPAATVTSSQIGVNPRFCPDCITRRHDIGYIVLEQPVTLPDGFPPLITDQATWDQTMGDGMPVTLVGYGQTSGGTPTPANDKGLGARRVVDSTMRPHGDSGVDFLAGSNGIDTCDGDSGGPALVVLPDGRWGVAGVLSGGLGPCGSGESVYSVPYPALAWIAEETGIDLLPANCQSGDCLDTSVAPEGCGCVAARPAPSPVSLAFLMLGLVRRRRAR